MTLPYVTKIMKMSVIQQAEPKRCCELEEEKDCILYIHNSFYFFYDIQT